MVVVIEILLCGDRESDSQTDTDSASKSNNSSNGLGLDTQGKIQKHEDYAQRNGNFELLHFLLISCVIYFIQWSILSFVSDQAKS